MAISNSAPDVGWAWAQLQSRPSLYPLAMNHNRLNQPGWRRAACRSSSRRT